MALAGAVPAHAAEQRTSPFPLTATDPGIAGATVGPDADLWYTEADRGALLAVDTAGHQVEIPTGLKTPVAPNQITNGDGTDVWFTTSDTPAIVHLTAPGVSLKYSVGIDPLASLGSIVRGGGGVWFAENGVSKIGRMTSSGVVSEYPVPVEAEQLALGLDGQVWFTTASAAFGRIDRFGKVTMTDLPEPATSIAAGSTSMFMTTADSVITVGSNGTPNVYSAGVASGSAFTSVTSPGIDGDVWFLDVASGNLGHFDANHAITMVTVDDGLGSVPDQVSLGADDNVWYSASNTNVIGRYRPQLTPTLASPVSVSATETTATFAASVTSDGAFTGTVFDFGRADGYEDQTAEIDYPLAAGPIAVSATATALLPGTSYHVRLEAWNNDGVLYSDDVTFKTLGTALGPIVPSVIVGTKALPAPAAPAGFGIASNRATVTSKGIMKLPVVCQPAAPCVGTVAVAARLAGKVSPAVVIATKPFNLTAGRKASLGLRVSAEGRKAIKRAGKKGLSVIATVTVASKKTRVRVLLQG